MARDFPPKQRDERSQRVASRAQIDGEHGCPDTVSWAATFLTDDIDVVEAREPAALISRRRPAPFVKRRRPNPVWLPRLCGLRLALIEFQFDNQ